MLSRFPFGGNVPTFRRLNGCVFSRLRPHSLTVRPPLTASRVISLRLRLLYCFPQHVGAALPVHLRPPPSFLCPRKAWHIACRMASISVSHAALPFPLALAFRFRCAFFPYQSNLIILTYGSMPFSGLRHYYSEPTSIREDGGKGPVGWGRG